MPGGDIAKILGGPWSPPEHIAPHIQLMQAMIDADLDPPDEILLDGNIHRFRTGDDRRDKSGWYVAYSDGIPAGCFGDWRTDTVHKWRASIGRELTEAEEIASQKRLDEAKRKRDEQRLRLNRAAAKACVAIWEATPEADTEHPYLKRKGILPHGVRQTSDGRLLCPLYNSEGEISTLQYISPDGRKHYHPGGAAKGSFWWLGDMGDAKRIYIAEGFATAASIHEVTGSPVVIAYSAGNLEPVTGTVRGFSPQASIIIVADNDASGTGQKAAEKAAEAHQAQVIIPPEIGDANDYLQGGGDLRKLLELSASNNKFSRNMIRPEDLQEAFLNSLTKTWAIKGILPESSGLIVIYGQPGTYKSFIAMDMALCMASGISWHGRDTKQKKVLYLAAEGQEGVLKRFEAWRQHHDLEELQHITLLPIACILDESADVLELLDALWGEEIVPDFIFVDTLARSMAGDENTKVDMGKVIAAADVIREQVGAQIVLIHHSGKDGKGPRGSGSLKGGCDTMFETQPGKEERQVLLVNERQKDHEICQPIGFTMQVIDTGYVDIERDPVTSLVPVLDSTVSTRPNKKEKRTEYLRIFVNAWIDAGSQYIDDRPYLNRSALLDKLTRDGFGTERTIKNHLNASYEKNLIGTLINTRAIESFQQGWIIVDKLMVQSLLLAGEGDDG